MGVREILWQNMLGHWREPVGVETAESASEKGVLYQKVTRHGHWRSQGPFILDEDEVPVAFTELTAHHVTEFDHELIRGDFLVREMREGNPSIGIGTLEQQHAGLVNGPVVER